MLADLRYALRGFHRSAGFTFVVVLSLALGIGANTAIFSLVNAILLRTLPVREPNRLVIFALGTPDRFSGSEIPLSLFQQIRDKNTVLDEFAGMGNPPMTITGGGSAERVDGQVVSGNFFETLGVGAALGRVLKPEDDRIPDARPVCVISYGLWQRRFGGDAGVIGRTLEINGHPLTVLGVTPKEFSGLSPDSPTDITVPLMMASVFKPNTLRLQPFGRLKPGVGIVQAQTSLDTLYHQLQTQQRSAGRPSGVKVLLQPGSRGISSLRSQYERPLVMLMAVVGLVLLIACANVTNLLLARASGRTREIAVRLALGAGRAQLVRLLLVESMLLTMGGAALGVPLAYWVDHALVVLAPQQIKGSGLIVAVNRDVDPDWRVLLFTLSVAVVVGVLSGILPAIRSTRADTRSGFGPALKGGAGVRSPGRLSFANAMAIVQVALSLVLLIAAGLFIRSLHNLRSVNLGFDPARMVMLTIEPRWSGYSPAASQDFIDSLEQRARNLPGVIAVSPGVVGPLSGEPVATAINVPGYVPQPNERWTIPEGYAPWMIPINYVGSEYFKTLGTPLVAGRLFNDEDGRVNKVAIVNQKTAAHYWPYESPIGKHILMGGREAVDCKVIGVVKDVKSESLRQEAPPMVYMPFRQSPGLHLRLHVRVAGNTAPVISALMRVVHELDPRVAAYNVTTMEEQLNRTISLDRLMATLTALFGLLAVVVAAVGLYGVMAFAVAARTREIGIRMALGAGSTRVLREVIGESAVLVSIGIAMGVPAALWASRGVGSFLYGLSATDPWTYALLAALLAAIALSAAWIPARRAAMVDPMIALRYE
jgi:predicted permease